MPFDADVTDSTPTVAGSVRLAPLPVTDVAVIVTTSVPYWNATAAITLAPVQWLVAGQWNVCACRLGRLTSGNTPRPIRSHRWPLKVVT